MPSLIRFLSLLGLLAATVYGGMVALAGLVEPTQREFVVLVPQDRMGKKVVSNSRRRTGTAVEGPRGTSRKGGFRSAAALLGRSISTTAIS